MSSSTAALPKRQRSAVTNGRRSFVVGDGNSAWARRHRDIVALHLDDLGPISTLSESQVSLAKRAATLEVSLEGLEGKMSLGEDVDHDLFNRMVGTLARTLDRLGLKRAARKGANPLAEHFAKPPVPKAAA